jgi:DNA-binding MarR family transcriptional regulator
VAARTPPVTIAQQTPVPTGAVTVTSKPVVTVDELRGALRDMLAAQRRLRGREASQRDDLSISQHAILRVLFDGVTYSCGELALATDLTPASMTKMLDGLAREHLVERVRNAFDRRRVGVRITPEGRRRFADKERRLRGVWEESVEAMTRDDIDGLLVALRQVSSLLDAL